MNKLFFFFMFFISTVHSHAQYFSHLYDIDSSGDIGWSIFHKTDSSYIVFSTSGVTVDNNLRIAFTDLEVSYQGNELSKKFIVYPYDSNNNYGISNKPGTIKRLPGTRGYLSCFNTYKGGYDLSTAGICRLNLFGDTIYTRSYTDTSLYNEMFFACDTMPNNRFIMGGRHIVNGGDIYHESNALLECADTNGTVKWKKIFRYNPSTSTDLYEVQSLPNGNLIVSCLNGELAVSNIGITAPFYYTHCNPWFILADSLGNILKDTFIFHSSYGGYQIYKDKQAGYFNYGHLDSVFSADASDLQNFPYYLARLDDSFRLMWRHSFFYSQGKKEIFNVKQLRDTGYLVYGRNAVIAVGYFGWATRLDKHGNVLWNHNFTIDSTLEADLDDVIEEPNGDFTFSGGHYDHSLPLWRHFDIWVMRTDSNGCPSVHCLFPTGVQETMQPPGKEFSVYPNPTNGSFTVSSMQEGQLTIYSLQGQVVANYAINAGTTKLNLPATLAPGMYTGKLVDNKGLVNTVRFIYQP